MAPHLMPVAMRGLGCLTRELAAHVGRRTDAERSFWLGRIHCVDMQ